METKWHPKEAITLKKFKSYYVVWKQLCCERVLITQISLNRTMQYGNSIEGEEEKK